MAKSTISMTIFNSKLLVYQAGYEYHIAQKIVDLNRKIVWSQPAAF